MAMPLPDDKNPAAVYAFFRIGSDDDGSSNLSQENFETLLAEITDTSKKYNAVPLQAIIDAQKSGASLPARTISLTFEMPDANFIKLAVPSLEKHKLPYTIFISAGAIDNANASTADENLTWDDIKQIAKNANATIGITAYNYDHPDGKTLETLSLDLNHARARTREKTGIEPQFFSYPFGEYTPEYINAVEKQNFVAAFGLQSGVASAGQPRHSLPRFTVTDDFAGIERFRMTSAALPLPVTNIYPKETLAQENPPIVAFTLATEIADQSGKLDCFTSGIGKIPLVSDKINRFNMAFEQKFEAGRLRINCTIPTPPPIDADGNETGEDARWRWLGFLITVPDTAKP